MAVPIDQTSSGPADVVDRSRPVRATLLLLMLSAGAFLLAGAPALGQTGYTGVGPPPPPPGDTYVGPYTGIAAAPGVAARLPEPMPRGLADATVSVASRGLGGPPQTVDADRRNLVTGWDLVALASLGLTAVVAFAVSTGRLRSP